MALWGLLSAAPSRAARACHSTSSTPPHSRCTLSCRQGQIDPLCGRSPPGPRPSLFALLRRLPTACVPRGTAYSSRLAFSSRSSSTIDGESDTDLANERARRTWWRTGRSWQQLRFRVASRIGKTRTQRQLVLRRLAVARSAGRPMAAEMQSAAQPMEHQRLTAGSVCVHPKSLCAACFLHGADAHTWARRPCCLQAVCALQCQHAGEPVWHVRQLHQVTGGHHERDTEGTECPVLQRVRAVLTAAADLGGMCMGVAGAPHGVHQAPARTK